MRFRLPLLLTILALPGPSVSVAAPALRFNDVSGSSGIGLVMTSGETPSREILEVNGGGVALLDYDDDGDLDLFVANGATLARPEQGPGSRLFANDGRGRFRDVTTEAGIRLTRWAMGVAVGDYDGDGHTDLYVTCFGPNVLLRNVDRDGKRGFEDVTDEAGVGDDRWSSSAAFADVDRDGDLDLYVANYLVFDPQRPPDRRGKMFKGVPIFAGPAGLEAAHDRLYENLGQGKFADVTAQRGCKPASPGYGLGVVILDFDDDGWQDIFVGNDSTENFLFRNLGRGKFENIGVVAGVATNFDGRSQATMGIGVGDVDGNGRPDLFTTNFSSDTNTLHLNLNGRLFDDRTSQYGLAVISRPFLSWGTGFYDFDSDGDEDLFIASGHIYPEVATHDMDSEYEQALLLFERDGGRFSRRTDAGAIFEQRYSGRSTAFGDLDDDGDVDIVMATLNDRVRVFRNDSPARDVVHVHPRNGLGSRVELATGDRVQRRWIHGGSYQSVDAPVAYFGLGDAKGPLSLRVIWPDGRRTEHGKVPRNRRLTITRDGRLEVGPFRGRK